MKRHVALVGFMASGKSTIGRKLARRLGWLFVDTDALIVREHGAIPAIFETQGEAAFRMYEQSAIRAALDRTPSHIIALGGGALTLSENRLLLEERAHRVFIRVSPEQVFARIRRSRGTRPMLGTAPTLERIRELYAARMADYAGADLVVDASQVSDAGVIDQIVAWLNERHAGVARAVP
jgi:shikimate kinase